jgi:hypothetical protein
MKTSSTAGLSILAGGLAFAGSLGAADLLVNGSFEEGPGVGWVGFFGTYSYSAAYYAGPPIPDSENPGASYSWKHGLNNDDFSVPLLQSVQLSPTVSDGDVDAGRGTYRFSAWMASYTDNPDRPYVTLQFLDAAQNPVGGLVALDRTSGANFSTFADGVTVFDRTTHESNWAKYISSGAIPSGARSARVGVTHSPNAAVSGRPDTYTDLVKLEVETAEFVPPSFSSSEPTGTAARPDANIRIVIQEGTSQIQANSIQLTLDGATIVPAVTKEGRTTTIAYDPPGLWVSSSTHHVRLLAADNSSPPYLLTNDYTFGVLSYYDLLLPPAIALETFDATPEGSLPNGWSGVTYSDVPDTAIDLGDLNSAAYAGWTVVDQIRFTTPLLSYTAHTPTDDYKRVLSVNPANVVNGAVVEHLAQNKICFGDSGYRSGNAQVMYLFSPDFNLSGRTNIYLSFHSLWEQNQDSIAAVEYSIDEGVTWLPIVYYLDRPDIVRDGDGNIDAPATFGTVRNDIAVYLDPADNLPKGGFYGAFIGVASNLWSELGSYLSPRVDDNPTESKRVEVFRLPAADNQSKVRLRFAHAGGDSWYFGIDNVGLYSITVLNPPLLTGSTPETLTEATGNSVAFTVTPAGVGPFTYQWRHNGTVLPGQTQSTLVLLDVKTNDAGAYTAVVGYIGGTVTSHASTLTVFIPPPSVVLGQWDFDGANLAATAGADLEFLDLGTDLATGFADSDQFVLPKIEGQSVNVMAFPGLVGGLSSGGFRMYHRLEGSGGGSNVNQYTLIFDILYPAGSSNVRRTLLQTDPQNVTDGSFRVDENNRVGVDGVYHGLINPDIWYRLALAVDLTGPGPNPIVAKFINGVKVGQQVLSQGRDGRWSLSANPATPYAILFGDNDVDVQPGFVSSIQLRSGRLADAAIAAMGAPSTGKIPGAASASVVGAQIVVRWSGTSLESADDPAGPWSAVAGAIKPYTIPSPLLPKRFYRAK